MTGAPSKCEVAQRGPVNPEPSGRLSFRVKEALQIGYRPRDPSLRVSLRLARAEAVSINRARTFAEPSFWVTLRAKWTGHLRNPAPGNGNSARMKCLWLDVDHRRN